MSNGNFPALVNENDKDWMDIKFEIKNSLDKRFKWNTFLFCYVFEICTLITVKF